MNEPRTSDLLEQAASVVPVGPAPVEDLLRAGRRARRRRQAGAHLAVAAGVVLVVGGSLTVLELVQPDDRSAEVVADAGEAGTPYAATEDGAAEQSAAGQEAADRPETAAGSAAQGGPLITGGSENCAVVYSPEAVRDQDFAFDGVVVGLGPPVSEPPTPLDETGVTFAVQEWFHGGSGATVTVDIPARPTPEQPLDGVRSYDVGTRLLVSGVDRAADGPLASTCGFTRYYDEQTAASWR
ncbi:hypothetical protein [Blastococcus sp. CCUG 61487]|uniref:hypothetical protein n=1 Tax=Blastococcus sp. CCUG 61487 TaxID=1840703 RepID=UPI0010C0DCE1|nr:hypothetical protein [Blastococcus sp. CCUG 61487]TKJ23452.1 hypothetical protein A6V29_05475 [Blastococcus sp. CCUG 61487]